MYHIFDQPKHHYTGELSLYGLRDFEKKLLLNYDTLKQYYATRTFFVKNEHLVARLIKTMSVPLEYDIDRYTDVVNARANQVFNSLKLTSAVGYGSWFTGQFYYGCPELIIGYVSDDDPEEVAKNWRDIDAVEVLEHPVSNLGLLLPTGENIQSERGLVTIGIDITKLMLQYRECILHQRATFDPNDNAMYGEAAFVSKYVLPNMVKSQTDIVMFNRIYNLHNGIPMGVAKRTHPFVISDYSKMFDGVAKQLIKRFDDQQFYYENMVSQFPAVFRSPSLRMPDIPDTRQVWWALFLTRMRAMKFLIELGGPTAAHFNGRDLTQLKVAVRYFRSSNIFNTALPNDLDIEVRAFFDQVKEL